MLRFGFGRNHGLWFIRFDYWFGYIRVAQKLLIKDPGPTLLLRDDGLVQYPEHIASPYKGEADSEEYGRTCFQGKWSKR